MTESESRMTNVFFSGLVRPVFGFWIVVVILHSLLVIRKAPAHPADVSQLRVKVAPQRLEFRLTLNLFCLREIVEIDRDSNGAISRKEIEISEPVIRDFLVKNVLVAINDADSDLGEPRPCECLWPNSGEVEIGPPDFPQRFVDFVFVKPWQPVIEDVWIGFNIFELLGEQHTVQAVFEQDGGLHEVGFSLFEPEYLYDTGYMKDAIQPAASTEPAGGEFTTGPATFPAKWPVTIALAALFAGIVIRFMLTARARRRSDP